MKRKETAERDNLLNVYDCVWAIVPERLRIIAAADKTYSEAEFKAYRTAQATKFQNVRGQTVLLPLYGLLTPRVSVLGLIFGGTPLDLFGAAFDDAVADKGVGAIVIDVDSPGGSIYGVHELAEKIYKARGKKPIIASVNGLAGSAAYWVASAADEVVVMPSGEVGSVGIFAESEDISEAEKKAGIKTTLVSAGKYKTEGNPHEPITDEAIAAIQERVDDYYEMMVESIARNRGVSSLKVESGFGEGRIVGAKQARRLKMVDRIGTLEQVRKRLHPSTQSSSAVNRQLTMRLAIARHKYSKKKTEGGGEMLPVICGFAMVFNVWSKADENNVIHKLLPGSLNEWSEHPNNVRALINHSKNCLLAQTKDNTLRLKIFSYGLYYELSPRTNASGLSILYEDIRRGRCQGASAKWKPIEFSDETYPGKPDRIIRTYSKIQLREISLMDFAGEPLFPQTSVRLKY